MQKTSNANLQKLGRRKAMSDTEYCRLCDSPVASAYDSYCKAHDADDEIIQLKRQLTQQESDYNDMLIALKEEHKKELEVYKSIAEEAIEVTPAHFDEGYGWSESIEQLKEKSDG